VPNNLEWQLGDSWLYIFPGEKCGQSVSFCQFFAFAGNNDLLQESAGNNDLLQESAGKWTQNKILIK
jgi:hypothetical protein